MKLDPDEQCKTNQSAIKLLGTQTFYDSNIASNWSTL